MTDTPPLPEPFASAPHAWDPSALGLSYCDPLDVAPDVKVIRHHCRRPDCTTCDDGVIAYATDPARLPTPTPTLHRPTYCQATGPVSPLYGTHQPCEHECPTCYTGHRARLLAVIHGVAEDLDYDLAATAELTRTPSRGCLQWPPTPTFEELLRPEGP